MNEMVMHEAMKRAALDQSARASAARAAFGIDTPRLRRTVRPIRLPPARQLPADRAGGAAEKSTDRLLATATVLLGKDHATFLAAEVLASSVHRNTLCPSGSGCCT